MITKSEVEREEKRAVEDVPFKCNVDGQQFSSRDGFYVHCEKTHLSLLKTCPEMTLSELNTFIEELSNWLLQKTSRTPGIEVVRKIVKDVLIGPSF